MAHNLELASDRSASLMLANSPAWHGLGMVLDHAPNSREAITVARMDRHVSMVELQTTAGHEVPGMFATVYDDKPSQILGVVSDRYQVVQNVDSFALLDSLVENGEMKYESCGALNGGANTWILARLPSVDEIAVGDDVLRYVLMSNSHDGKSALKFKLCATRVVCANTLAMAMQENGAGMTIRHKGNMTSKLDIARKFLSQFDKQFTLFRDDARKLAERRWTAQQEKDYIAELFPMPTDESGKVIDGRGATITQNKIEDVRRAMRLGRNNLESIRGTWWQLLNAVTDSVDHAKDKTGMNMAKREKNFVNLIEGSAAELKLQALNVALAMSA